MAKSYDERRTELEQKIHQLQKEKRKLDRQQQQEERRHRDHVMIVTGAHLLTHFRGAEEQLLTMTDDEIRAWVDSLFTKRYGDGK